MWKIFFRPFAVLFAVLILPTVLLADDPGLPDTVYISGGPLYLNQSHPISISITNDEAVGGWSLGFLLQSLDGGFAKIDSAHWVGRVADPSVFGFRVNKYCVCEPSPGVSPDIVVSGADKFGMNELPPGRGEVLELFFTGLSEGSMTFDSTYFPPAGSFILVNAQPVGPLRPQFVGCTIEVLGGSLPPLVTVPDSPLDVSASQSVAFNVSGYSPGYGAISVHMTSFHKYDDDLATPQSAPVVAAGSPLIFQWTPSTNDVGVWLATFQVCDTSMTCAENSVLIEVCDNSLYIVDFDRHSTGNGGRVQLLALGDVDDDGVPEIMAASHSSSVEQGFYTIASSLDIMQIDSISIGYALFGVASGMIDSDDLADFATMRYYPQPAYRIRTLLSNGDLTFDEIVSSAGTVTRSCALAELNNDEHLDVAAAWSDYVQIFSGDSQGHFTLDKTISVPAATTTVNAGDFNGDGRNDLAIGTSTGTRVYLQQTDGSFLNTSTYSQSNGSLDIEVTNQGSDFNNDGKVDLCISTPSVGGARSQMVAYFGNADGSFSQSIVRDVKGQIFGNCVGDVNADGKLDIVYVNGSHNYVAMIFGDAQNQFKNEIRIPIPQGNPQAVASTDADLDGDLDLIVAANLLNGTHIMYLFENLLNPGGLERRAWSLDARDNVDLSINSPSGKLVSRIHNAVASASYNERNADSDERLDTYAKMGTVEAGRYIVHARPRAEAQANETFSIDFVLNGQKYRLAKNIAMPAQGYDFGVYAGSSSQVNPRPGTFSLANPPSFSWQGQGSFTLQVATDPGFQNLVVNTTVNGSNYQVAAPMAVQDTTAIFWRVKPTAAPAYDCIYTLNLVAASSSCGDADGSGIVTISDAVFLINYIFAGGPEPQPYNAADTDCSGQVNISDVVYLINYIFGGGPTPCSGC